LRILLDECLPKDLRKYLVGHECKTVPEAGFSGQANGELLALAERAGWEVFLTVDQGIEYQQSPAGRTLSLIITRTKSNRLADLSPLVPGILHALRAIKPGQLVGIDRSV
jgi:hypothetical protein